MRKFDLEVRLTDFAVQCIDIAGKLPKNIPGMHLSNQLTRSGTSPSLNYGEAQSAESRKDFIHKVRIILKELRETRICLNIISRTVATDKTEAIVSALSECDELISIFVKSEQTAKRNMTKINR
jgi:four helix bundle protein